MLLEIDLLEIHFEKIGQRYLRAYDASQFSRSLSTILKLQIRCFLRPQNGAGLTGTVREERRAATAGSKDGELIACSCTGAVCCEGAGRDIYSGEVLHFYHSKPTAVVVGTSMKCGGPTMGNKVDLL